MIRVMLLHGWGTINYTANCIGEIDPWRNRRRMVDILEKEFDVKIVRFPGFCGEPEPIKPWNLDDFAQFINDKTVGFDPDFILGYSFGGAVALNFKLNYNNQQKLILISPALVRQYKKPRLQQRLISTAASFIPTSPKDLLRDFYLSRIINNPFYAQGTSFLKKSYLNIVAVDLSEKIMNINLDDIRLIFGDEDTETPPYLLLNKVPSACPNVCILKGGTHDIANTHTVEVLDIIREFIKEKSK